MTQTIKSFVQKKHDAAALPATSQQRRYVRRETDEPVTEEAVLAQLASQGVRKKRGAANPRCRPRARAPLDENGEDASGDVIAVLAKRRRTTPMSSISNGAVIEQGRSATAAASSNYCDDDSGIDLPPSTSGTENSLESSAPSMDTPIRVPPTAAPTFRVPLTSTRVQPQ